MACSALQLISTQRATVRAGRLRCWSAPPPGPLAGAGRCVGLGLSPAIASLPFMLLARALVSYACSNKASVAETSQGKSQLSVRGQANRPASRRPQGALPVAYDAVDRRSGPASPRLSGLWQTHSEADTCSCYVPHTAAQASRIGVATRTNGLCSVVSKAACARVAAV